MYPERMNQALHKLEYYITPDHSCNYIPGRQARTLVADPGFPLNHRHYTRLANMGFRRSGSYIYRPNCLACHACVPVRVAVNEFSMRRSHRRTWLYNRDLAIKTVPAQFREDYFSLYSRYINTRHKNGGMENPTPTDFMQFLTCDWAETLFFEMRLDGRLLAVAVADRLDDGLSAVYTFFEPNAHKRSPGIFAILYEISEAARFNLDWLYLGYWIAECDKMRYKNQFTALQYFHGNGWKAYPPE